MFTKYTNIWQKHGKTHAINLKRESTLLCSLTQINLNSGPKTVSVVHVLHHHWILSNYKCLLVFVNGTKQIYNTVKKMHQNDKETK